MLFSGSPIKRLLSGGRQLFIRPNETRRRLGGRRGLGLWRIHVGSVGGDHDSRSRPPSTAGLCLSGYGFVDYLRRRAMGANRPDQASKLFEERFAVADLDGLMDLYEDRAVFTNAARRA
jgi:hypothetical protein